MTEFYNSHAIDSPENLKVKEAVTLLLKKGYTLSSEAFQLLRTMSDPIESANALLKELDHDKPPRTIIDKQTVAFVCAKLENQSYNKKVDRSTTQVTLEGEATWGFLRPFSIEESHQYTHGLHLYPAKMVPQIARELIAKLSDPSDVVLDPFCGSGGVLVESLVANRNSIGTDINLLALLLARVKTTPISKQKIHTTMGSIIDEVRRKAKEPLEPNLKLEMEKIPNLYHWFKPYVAKDLQILKSEIQNIMDKKLREFFFVCFSATMYDVSNIRKSDNPYFIRVWHKEELARHKPKVLERFARIVRRNANAIETLSKVRKRKLWVKTFKASAQDLVSTVGKKAADLIVTSPPYGEERNTMDYTRFSKLSLYWLGFGQEHVQEMRGKALGVHPRRWQKEDIPSKTLAAKLSEVASKNQMRAEEVYSFFHDYLICLRQMFDALKEDSYCCIVIGDRTASRIPIPNGKITSELCESVGYIPVEMLERKMYMRTLRSSVIGSEHVLIMKRP